MDFSERASMPKQLVATLASVAHLRHVISLNRYHGISPLCSGCCRSLPGIGCTLTVINQSFGLDGAVPRRSAT